MDEQAQELTLEELETRLKETEHALKCAYYGLGKCLYEAAERRVAEINILTERLIELKQALSHARADIVCPRCTARNPIENRYCGRCGYAFERLDDENFDGEEENE